ncbi:hypothetical protein CAMGR0001_2349 [Campylobacter gracilis RM3268]|uniref:Uncharacterized protein n=1 Tax=Campylobacter gracilis RM3268 TaxID=553220 RepID=C8PDZ9_9BACT|nr:hypothetical protein CAMGR0001_2349 [Campylobacter gracilis RM3268]
MRYVNLKEVNFGTILKFASASDLKFQVARFGISIIDFEF